MQWKLSNYSNRKVSNKMKYNLHIAEIEKRNWKNTKKLIDKSRLTFKETTYIMLYYMYKIYQSSTVGNTCILLFFAFFRWLRIKIQMKIQRQMMWDQNALGYVISKITLIPYFIKTNHLDIIKLYVYWKMVLHIVRL